MVFLNLDAFKGMISPDACIFFTVGDKAIVTKGFVKKMQKTPRETLEKAKEYRTDYERRFRK